MRFAAVALGVLVAAAQGSADKEVYLRRSGRECAFTLRKTEAEWSIESVTTRGKTTLTVTSRYDPKDALLGAEAVLGDKKAAVTVAGGKASVRREGLEPQEFEVPPGVIVTSAPDWTDTFLICRRYDRARGGRQEFPGLWIHPEQPAQRLTFTAEKLGSAVLEDDGKKLEVDRLSIVLRGNSRYTAWADREGRMIKLVDAGATELVREGSERWAKEIGR